MNCWILAVCVSLGLACSASAQNGEVAPAPDGVTLEYVIERVVQAEQQDGRTGPDYLVVREGFEGVSGLPIMSVLKRIDGLGYWHMPPDLVKMEVPGQAAVGPTGTDPLGLGHVAATVVQREYISGMAIGLAGISQAIFGPSVVDREISAQARLFLAQLERHDWETLQIGRGATAFTQDQLSNILRLIEVATLAGTTTAWGEDAFYIVAEDTGLKVPINGPASGGVSSEDETQPARGHMIIDKVELWVGREHFRIVGLRIRAHGASDAIFNIDVPEISMAPFWGDTKIIPGAAHTLPIGRIVVEQSRERYFTTATGDVELPQRRASRFLIAADPDSLQGSTLLELARSIAGARNQKLENMRDRARERAELFSSTDEFVFTPAEEDEWAAVNEYYERVMAVISGALEAASEGLDANATTVVNCVVPVATASALVGAIEAAAAGVTGTCIAAAN